MSFLTEKQCEGLRESFQLMLIFSYGKTDVAFQKYMTFVSEIYDEIYDVLYMTVMQHSLINTVVNPSNVLSGPAMLQSVIVH